MKVSRIELYEVQKTEYRKKLVETFKVFDKFCQDNKINYFATGGTLIGTVRHKGIIPWDDDIDVAMPLKDFQKFQTLKSQSLSLGYEIKDYNDAGYYLPYIKFMDANTSIWEVKEREYIIGVFIDVFPLFYTNDDLCENKTKIEKYKLLFSQYSAGYKQYHIRTLAEAILGLHLGTTLQWLRGFFYYRFIKRTLYCRFTDYHNELSSVHDGNCMINYSATYPVEKELFKKEWFEESILLPFEDTQIFVPAKYHEILSNLYGDYMTPPPVEQRISHHYLYFMDLDKRLTIDEIKRIKKNGK